MSGKVGNTSTHILDNYPNAAAAWSLRRLTKKYKGPAIKIRRGSDNQTIDIFFRQDGLIDVGAIASFCGSSTGYVTIWYDQSGNGINAYQNTNVQQHGIFNTYLNEGITSDGGKPFLHTYFENISKKAMLLTSPVQFKSAFTVAHVFNISFNRGTGVNYLMWGEGYNTGIYYAANNIPQIQGLGIYDTTNVYSLTGKDTNRHLGYFNISNNIAVVSKDGGANTTMGPTPISSMYATSINGRYYAFSGLLNFDGGVQEIILYNSDQSSNSSAIKSNINSYYSVY